MSNKMIIFNCSAYKGFTKDIPDWLDNTNCGQYTGQVSCADCTDCIIKQVIEKCRDVECPCEYKGLDCWECTESGARRLAERILQLFDIEEVE